MSPVPYRCPDCGGEVDLARTPLESGLVRLAALGADGFVLEFDAPEVHARAREALGDCPHVADPIWDAGLLQPLALLALALSGTPATAISSVVSESAHMRGTARHARSDLQVRP